MCVIIDTNRLCAFANGDAEEPLRGDMARLRKWVEDDGRIVYYQYGKYMKEVERANVTALMEGYKGAGKAKLFDKGKYKNAIKKFDKLKVKSNDQHILALAEASGVTMLCTGDNRLIRDFKKYIPGAKIYPDSETYPNSPKVQEKMLRENKCP